MESKSLRIGNYYLGASRGRVEVVKWETLRDLEEKRMNALPLKLTEEWLLKFGFEKDSWEDNGLVIPLMRKNIVYIDMIFMEMDIEGQKIELKFVHQLQNLWFCLFGEEL